MPKNTNGSNDSDVEIARIKAAAAVMVAAITAIATMIAAACAALPWR